MGQGLVSHFDSVTELRLARVGALALVTTAHLPLDQQKEAQRTVKEVMYPNADEPRHFKNLTQFIIGRAGQ